MSTDAFPVDSFREAAPHLRRPFTVPAVKFKIQSVTKGDQRQALVVAYIDARLVVERLNLVCPHLWTDAFDGPECLLTVDNLTRRDVGEGQGKALRSDALKRAAVKFGIGVSLYATPQTWLPVDGQHVKAGRKENEAYLKPKGEKVCRDRYAEWLRTVGIKSFGDPLDHGDTDDSQGDVEADNTPVPADDAPANGTHPEAKLLSDEGRARVGQALAKSQADTGMVLAAAGFADLESVRTVGDAHKVRARLDEAEAALAQGASQ